MDNLNFVISFKFKGQEDVQKLFKEIGKKHNIEIDIDTSKVQLGLQQVQQPSFNPWFAGSLLSNKIRSGCGSIGN